MRYLIAIVLLLCSIPTVFSAQIKGRVVLGDEPLPGMLVRAYADLNSSTPPIAESAITQADGLFQLEVPE